VGINAVKSIVQTRKQGSFTSLFDFCQRIDLSQINKRMMENLIVAGCFDALHITRKQALSIMDECMELASQIKLNENSQQISLFGDSSELIVEEPRSKVKGEMDVRELLSREKEVLGFYVSENPLDRFKDIIPLIVSEELGSLRRTRMKAMSEWRAWPVNSTKK
jgi:DNA polymerase-3 subunit alpha